MPGLRGHLNGGQVVCRRGAFWVHIEMESSGVNWEVSVRSRRPPEQRLGRSNGIWWHSVEPGGGVARRLSIGKGSPVQILSARPRRRP